MQVNTASCGDQSPVSGLYPARVAPGFPLSPGGFDLFFRQFRTWPHPTAFTQAPVNHQVSLRRHMRQSKRMPQLMRENIGLRKKDRRAVLPDPPLSINPANFTCGISTTPFLGI